MNKVRHTFWLAIAVVSTVLIGVPEALYAGPKLQGPSRSKRPKIAGPSMNQSTAAGFEAGPDAVTNYQVDVESQTNEVVFTSKAPKETIKGRSTKAAGNLEFNPRHIEAVSGSFSVLWTDLDTGKAMMNKHMMASPWVNAEAHPKIEFTVSEFLLAKTQPKPGKKGQAIKGRLVGKFSMNGKDKEMKIPVTFAYVPGGKNDEGEDVKEGIGVKSKFSVALADFDIKGMNVGEKVAKKQQISVSLFLIKSNAKPESEGEQAEEKDEKEKKDEEAKES